MHMISQAIYNYWEENQYNWKDKFAPKIDENSDITNNMGWLMVSA